MSSHYDVCVIGAGPAGLTAAMELASQGLTVALVESGADGSSDVAQRLSDADIVSTAAHSVMDEAVRRGLGGTSAIWGGRCVPLDAIDFEHRDFVTLSDWPFGATELQPYYRRACELLDVGEPNFAINDTADSTSKNVPLSSNFRDNNTIRATELERWSRQANTWHVHKSTIEATNLIKVFSGLTCVGFCHGALNGAVDFALFRPTALVGAQPMRLAAKVFIIASGGVESTRLVLNSMADPAGLKVATPSLVGRYYMGHPSGKIVDIELAGDPADTLFGFERDSGVYVRRRITFRPDVMHKNALLNIAFWLDNAPISDWRHGSGVLSAAYLALTAPWVGRFLAPAAIRKRAAGDVAGNRLHHLWNCLRSPVKTVTFCFGFCYKRYFAKPRVPGFFTYSSTNRYALHYHAEQVPNWHSTIGLSDAVDAHGLRRARINLEWSTQDIDSIIKAHQVLDAALLANGIGKLIYRYEAAALPDAIREQAVDGFHQIGTLRMANDPASGVTDPFGRLFGTTNCFVASSATFPTSGQANPTLALVALTVRQARHIAESLRNQEPAHA